MTGQILITTDKTCSMCGSSKEVNTWESISEAKDTRTALKQATLYRIAFSTFPDKVIPNTIYEFINPYGNISKFRVI